MITVTERDLRRCGNNLKLLREAQQTLVREKEEARHREELALSFKSAFAKRCRSDADLRDPWKDMKNPEETREKRESDLIINQVWVMPSPKKLEFDGIPASKLDGDSPPSARRSTSVSTRASSVDLPTTRSLTKGSTGGSEGRTLVRRRSRGSGLPSVSTVESVRGEGGARGPNGRGGGCPRPEPGPRVEQTPAAAKGNAKVKNRIQPLESPRSSEGNPEDDGIGSFMVREATRMQRHFTQQIDETRHSSGGHSAWLALDRQTGKVELYPKAAGARIESAFRHGRTSVPLAGTGDNHEGSIVQFASGEEDGKPLERTWDGDFRDVRRIEVHVFMTDAVVHVQRDGGEWRLADAAVPGKTEERHVQLSRNEVVTPPSPTLPPVNPDRRPQCFLNPGADWAP